MTAVGIGFRGIWKRLSVSAIARKEPDLDGGGRGHLSLL